MSDVKTVELTGPDGQAAIVNECDAESWQANGWKPAAAKKPTTKKKTTTTKAAKLAGPEE